MVKSHYNHNATIKGRDAVISHLNPKHMGHNYTHSSPFHEDVQASVYQPDRRGSIGRSSQKDAEMGREGGRTFSNMLLTRSLNKRISTCGWPVGQNFAYLTERAPVPAVIYDIRLTADNDGGHPSTYDWTDHEPVALTHCRGQPVRKLDNASIILELTAVYPKRKEALYAVSVENR